MRSRCRPMRSSSPEVSCRSFSHKNTPLALPESCTTSCGPSKRKTACTGAMNGSLSSFTSPSPTCRPTLVSSFTRTKSAEVLPSRAMADSRARGFEGAAGLGGAGGGERVIPVTGLGGGGGAGRAAAVGGLVAIGGGGGLAAGAAAFAGAAGAGAGGRAPAGLAAAVGAALAAGLAGAGGAAAGPGAGALVAASGVPQRAQNLKVAAFKVMQFGHCLGGAPAARRGPVLAAGGGATGFCIMVGALSSSSPMGAPHDRQEPTSVSLFAPQRGHSMPCFYNTF